MSGKLILKLSFYFSITSVFLLLSVRVIQSRRHSEEDLCLDIAHSTLLVYWHSSFLPNLRNEHAMALPVCLLGLGCLVLSAGLSHRQHRSSLPAFYISLSTVDMHRGGWADWVTNNL